MSSLRIDDLSTNIPLQNPEVRVGEHGLSILEIPEYAGQVPVLSGARSDGDVRGRCFASAAIITLSVAPEGHSSSVRVRRGGPLLVKQG